MTHTVLSPRTTPCRAPWRHHCTSTTEILRGFVSSQDRQNSPAAVNTDSRQPSSTDPAAAGAPRAEADGQFSAALADIATAMALLGFAIDNGWLYADELASARPIAEEVMRTLIT